MLLIIQTMQITSSEKKQELTHVRCMILANLPYVSLYNS